mmetsp:Transcript_16795/g.32135  ORF Transcript_16795/g.32135 Transcript_16795/m.32135 type:complete len:377 (-) Transcript_16795:609-1739(-)
MHSKRRARGVVGASVVVGRQQQVHLLHHLRRPVEVEGAVRRRNHLNVALVVHLDAAAAQVAVKCFAFVRHRARRLVDVEYLLLRRVIPACAHPVRVAQIHIVRLVVRARLARRVQRQNDLAPVGEVVQPHLVEAPRVVVAPVPHQLGLGGHAGQREGLTLGVAAANVIEHRLREGPLPAYHELHVDVAPRGRVLVVGCGHRDADEARLGRGGGGCCCCGSGGWRARRRGHVQSELVRPRGGPEPVLLEPYSSELGTVFAVGVVQEQLLAAAAGEGDLVEPPVVALLVHGNLHLRGVAYHGGGLALHVAVASGGEEVVRLPPLPVHKVLHVLLALGALGVLGVGGKGVQHAHLGSWPRGGWCLGTYEGIVLEHLLCG